MRTILKDEPPPLLERKYENSTLSSSRGAENLWGRFKGSNGGKQTRSWLLEQQWWLCAYTEISLKNFEHGSHLEHIEPKSRNPQRTFDYHNIVVSALHSDALHEFSKQDRFGGHFKLKEYDPGRFVSPLQPDCERYFDYLSSGRVEPAHALNEEDKEKAQYTIDLLNLNARYLVNARRHWLEEIEYEIDKLLDDITALKRLAECELCDTTGALRQFHTAAKKRFGRLGDQVMDEFCPQCLTSTKNTPTK